MPEVHFVGTLLSTSNIRASAVSVTWAIVPGNNAWAAQRGHAFGETHICETKGNGTAWLDHPIDIHFDASSTEGWPVMVFEIWDRSVEDLRGFCGCGSVWLPSAPGRHVLDVVVWKPVTFDDGVIPDALREYILKPNARNRLQTSTIGDIKLEIYTVCSDFESHGVSLS